MDLDLEKLISLVKARPDICIHSKPKKASKYAALVDRHWKDISIEMNCTEKECRLQWNKLRYYYTRLFRHNLRYPARKKTWYLQKEMAFIDKYVKQTKQPISIECRDPYITDNESAEPSYSAQTLVHNTSSANGLKVERTRKLYMTPENANELFLESQLPDLNQLSAEKQLAYKRTVKDLLRNLTCEFETLDVAPRA